MAKIKPTEKPRRKRTDPWDTHMVDTMAAIGYPWEVRRKPGSSLWDVWTKGGQLVATTPTEGLARAVCGMPQALAAMLGANRVIETVTEFEYGNLSAAKEHYALLFELNDERTNKPDNQPD